MRSPLLTATVHERLRDAARVGPGSVRCSLDLERTTVDVVVDTHGWAHAGKRYPFLDACKDRTIYHWVDGAFEAVTRYTTSLFKLVPTQWGPPTFEIDGIKMLPTEHVSPYEDAARKVALIRPRGKVVLDTCGGLGYFGEWCMRGQAREVLSFEKSAEVLWLRSLNPWSPDTNEVLKLMHADIVAEIERLPSASVDAALHDPPRIGIAGELYSLAFYQQLGRVLKRGGRLFHYTGTPNKLTSGRDVPREVAARLQTAGFKTRPERDGILATAG